MVACGATDLQRRSAQRMADEPPAAGPSAPPARWAGLIASRRPPALLQKDQPQADALGLIHFQELNRRTPFGRQPTQHAFLVEREVLAPALLPRMKQTNDIARRWIHGRDVRPLLEVTAKAAQAQVGLVVGTLVLTGDDMVDVMW